MNNALEEAIKERDRYLKEHPEHQWFQDKIDAILSKTPEHLRLEVLKTMLLSSTYKLQQSFLELQHHMATIDEAIKRNID